MLGLWVCKLRSLATKHGSRTKTSSYCNNIHITSHEYSQIGYNKFPDWKDPPAPAAASAWRRRSGDGSGKEGADGIVGDGVASPKHDAIGISINENSTFWPSPRAPSPHPQFRKAKLRQPTGQRLSKVRVQQTKISIGPILFLYYQESLVSSNLNSKQLWFHGVRLLKWPCHFLKSWALLSNKIKATKYDPKARWVLTDHIFHSRTSKQIV